MRRILVPSILATILATTMNGCCFKNDSFNLRSSRNCYIPSAATLGPSQLRIADAAIINDCGTGIPEAFAPYDVDETILSSENLLPLTLQSCVSQALATSKIMRDLGGTIIRTPDIATSKLDPALVFSDPRFGEEAALSAFDANLFASSLFEENNRRFNNAFFGQLGMFEQYLSTSQMGVSKRSATGGLFNFRNVTVGDNNNQSGNRLGNIPNRGRSWDTFLEAEVRQPLLKGAGTEYNRIAGPGGETGVFNGVLIARTNTDQSLVEIERSVRDLVAEVENSYWDLYYAYRDLEAKIMVRDIAENTLVKTRERNPEGGEANILQAEEQVYRFQADIVDALNGRPIDGTRINNGSAGGTFRGVGGIRTAERKLRLLVGLPINDGRLIQPIDPPSVAPVIYDWHSAIADALIRREELRKQRWQIKQRELELIASRNHLRPQLDVIGRYRYRGFGERLLGGPSGVPPNSFFDGQLQEWAVGVEYALPVGLRRANAAVRNARLALTRETEILREQERIVHLGLSNAINDSMRAYENMNLQDKRLGAIVGQLNALEERKEINPPPLDVVLETHRRLLDARLRYHQSQVEYALALRNVHFEKGTLLSYNNVLLAETVSNPKALIDATERIQFQDGSVETVSKDITLTMN